LWAHPDLLEKHGRILTLDILLNDPRTLIQRMRTGCAAAFDARTIPHVGQSFPGEDAWRVIMDADFQPRFPLGAVDLHDERLYPAVYT